MDSSVVMPWNATPVLENCNPLLEGWWWDDWTMEKLHEVVSRNLRLLKEARGLTEAEIASSGRMGAGSVNRMLHGHDGKLSTLQALARAFNVPPWALLLSHLDPDNLPSATTETEIERQVAIRLEERWGAIQKQVEALRVHQEEGRPSAANPFADRETAGQGPRGRKTRR